MNPQQPQQGLAVNSSLSYANDAGFDFTAPRPPVPGKETRQSLPQYVMEKRAMSPTPRRFSSFGNDPLSSAPMGYEPEGSCRSASRSSSSPSPPAWFRWNHSLHGLLADSDGAALFRTYLVSEGPQFADPLDFWFACEGLRKQHAPEKIHQLAKVIYKKFFVKSALPINEELRKEISKNLKSSQCLEPPVTLFDRAQACVEAQINATTYPNFLKSELYLRYVQFADNSASRSSSELSSNEQINIASAPDLLPTLHEDMELVMNQPNLINQNSGTASVGYQTPNPAGSGAVRLTKDLLLMSQKHRAVELRPKSEAYASDGRSLGRPSKRQAVLERRHARESAAMNRETFMNQTLIPRTQRMDSNKLQPMQPEQFAAILTQKLDVVKRERDTKELLEKKLKESESMTSIDKIRMLQLEDDNDQDILDQHVSRVFSDLTPARSPGVQSPTRAMSPPRSKRQVYPRTSRRRDKDGFSTFSSDSGNVHDYAESLEHKMSMVKSKSMPEYAEERFGRNNSACRRSSSKKTLTDFTDSGVSVVSDTPPALNMPPPKDNRVLAWLMESDKSGRCTYSEMSPKHKSHRASSATSPSSSRHRKGFGSRSSSLERNSVVGTLGPAQPFVADPNMPPLPSPNIAIQLEEARRRLLEEDSRKPKQRVSGRYYPEGTTPSSQSTMRRSLRGTSSSARPTTQQQLQQQLQMPTTTGAAPAAPAAPLFAPEDLTTVVFNFCDEQFPYRTKIPGSQVTLRQFKEYLPKKGNYRFFFKTVCEEFQVIHEEVTNDGDILPLWEGKVMAQVKPLD
ncbi:unnamed protein product [Brassicogethes aeneus]|uniref:Axin n=1 Tax=Brassicogethes aeneus TaxID=1431903 RepID=A0A9P0BK30_BRAAE|nr:unnamed protein product [Brassicogethes aeneus]